MRRVIRGGEHLDGQLHSCAQGRTPAGHNLSMFRQPLQRGVAEDDVVTSITPMGDVPQHEADPRPRMRPGRGKHGIRGIDAA